MDLTPAALGPFVVPVVNLDEHLETGNLNMISCGGQATIPIVAAVSRVTEVPYAEIVASVSSCPPGLERAPTSTSSPRRRRGASRSWAALGAAGRSSSSTLRCRRSRCAAR